MCGLGATMVCGLGAKMVCDTPFSVWWCGALLVCGGVVHLVFGGVEPSGCVVQFLSQMCSFPFATGVGWQLGARLAGYIHSI